MSTCCDPSCTCWWPPELREPIVQCSGNIEHWDITVGCEECGWQLWEWHTWAGEVCMDEAIRRFDAAHPWTFDEAHDHGDEDRPPDWFDPQPPFGGWRFPSFLPKWHQEQRWSAGS